MTPWVGTFLSRGASTAVSFGMAAAQVVAPVVALAATLAAALAVAGAGGASADTIRLRIGAGHPGNATWTAAMREVFQPGVASRVENETGNKLEWVETYGGAVCKLGECLEAVESGLLDIGDVESIFEPAKLQALNFSLFVPFSIPDPVLNTKVVQDVYNRVPQLKDTLKKYNQVYLGAGIIGNYGILTAFPWEKQADLVGRKIAAGGPNIPWIAPIGIVPVQAVLTEVYTSLQTGVYQGVVMFPDAVISFRLNEVAKQFAEMNFGTVASALLTINKTTWDGLSPAVQKILTEEGARWSSELGTRTARLQAEALVKMEASGVKLVKVSDADRHAWAAKLDNLPKRRYEELIKAGQPANAIYEYIRLQKEAGHVFPRDWAAEK
ncbi:MAG: C4-dicarboxylate TRAP transporter substrate-binding protein [Hyphomicrobiaceae bacterium]|nr:C4-dicarboxylate TRAP transporter substrate-binding protein [Hyphomicrobiaceae bacterium]